MSIMIPSSEVFTTLNYSTPGSQEPTKIFPGERRAVIFVRAWGSAFREIIGGEYDHL